MNKCKRCNVWVADDTMVCPLCHTILTENKSMEQSLDHNANKMQGVQRPGYPDVKKNTRRFQKSRKNSFIYFAGGGDASCIYQLSDLRCCPEVLVGCNRGNHCVSDPDSLGYFQQKTGHIQKIYTQILLYWDCWC